MNKKLITAVILPVFLFATCSPVLAGDIAWATVKKAGEPLSTEETGALAELEDGNLETATAGSDLRGGIGAAERKALDRLQDARLSCLNAGQHGLLPPPPVAAPLAPRRRLSRILWLAIGLPVALITALVVVTVLIVNNQPGYE